MTHWSNVILIALTLIVASEHSKCYAANGTLEKQAAAVLQRRYETVVGVRSKILSQMHFDDPTTEFGRKYLGLPFLYLMGGLKAVRPGTLAVVEGGSDLVLAGARDFVAPTGADIVRYRTCYIAILTSAGAQTIAAEFNGVAGVRIDGKSVWTWSVPPDKGQKMGTTFYAAVLSKSVLVVANDRENFREAANAMGSLTDQAEVPKGPDLTSLRDHGYWAHREFRGPVRRLPASTVASSLFTGFNDGRLVLRIMVPDDGSGSTPANLPSTEAIQFHRAGTGGWEAVIDLATPQVSATVLEVLSIFGYGIAF